MRMIIILVGTLTQIIMGVGGITLPNMVPGGANMPFLCQIPELLCVFSTVNYCLMV